MPRVRNVLYLFLSLLFLVSPSHGVSDILLNGSTIPLVTGDSYGLYQGYILTLKSVSEDSVWLQLIENDKIVKSEVVAIKGYFIYNKANRTILSVKVDNIYSGSPEQNLVSLFPVYQFIDPEKPLPDITEVIPKDTRNPVNDKSSVRIHTPREPVIWTLGIVFVLILFYILRKYW
ncbi:MAG: S-layer protein domain-containing protein [Candidatus Methanoperedens sp.]|nr:S-layer protein domain-containing protein [Candidatus Methanoperedens sp.]